MSLMRYLLTRLLQMMPRILAEFNKLVEDHCQAKSNRPKKIQALKNKVLAQVKVIERRHRGLSFSSSGSDKRHRSGDSQDDVGSASHFASLHWHNDLFSQAK